ncbi:hypothetical protein C8J57DRAFT_1223729 [Mycena rebaudengoi]|nr:hypothetical protein C8J57DRAFT_1223729 [Mycena rebaudengoi]
MATSDLQAATCNPSASRPDLKAPPTSSRYPHLHFSPPMNIFSFHDNQIPLGVLRVDDLLPVAPGNMWRQVGNPMRQTFLPSYPLLAPSALQIPLPPQQVLAFPVTLHDIIHVNDDLRIPRYRVGPVAILVHFRTPRLNSAQLVCFTPVDNHGTFDDTGLQAIECQEQYDPMQPRIILLSLTSIFGRTPRLFRRPNPHYTGQGFSRIEVPDPEPLEIELDSEPEGVGGESEEEQEGSRHRTILRRLICTHVGKHLPNSPTSAHHISPSSWPVFRASW